MTAVNPASAQGGSDTLVAGVVTYNPPPNFAGADAFVYTVSDGQGGVGTGVVNVTIGPGQIPSQNRIFKSAKKSVRISYSSSPEYLG